MGFLKKSTAPDELPDLALDSPVKSPVKPAKVAEPVVAAEPVEAVEAVVAAEPVEAVEPIVVKEHPVDIKPHHKEVKKVVKKEPSETAIHSEKMKIKHEDIKKQISEHIDKGNEVSQVGFFDKILDDVNEEIGDLDKLGEWYEKKFLSQDVVSDMKGYWEGNKEDILIQSFGTKYKKEINERIKILQKLEGDWRDIYFKLIKKEEEMKKEERELKDTLSEFVGLCKGRKTDEKKTKKK